MIGWSEMLAGRHAFAARLEHLCVNVPDSPTQHAGSNLCRGKWVPWPQPLAVSAVCGLSAGYTGTHRLCCSPHSLCIRRTINSSTERCFEAGEHVDWFWKLDLFLHSSKGSPALQKLTGRELIWKAWKHICYYINQRYESGAKCLLMGSAVS